MHKIKVDRLLVLLDGIIAISLTLLLISLLPPTLSESTNASLGDVLRQIFPHFLSYSICFFVCLLFWFLHHIIYHNIDHITPQVLYLNLIWLLVVTLLPVFTMLMYESNNVVFTIIFHILLLIVVCLTYSLWYFSYDLGVKVDFKTSFESHKFLLTSLLSVAIVDFFVVVFVFMYGFFGLLAWCLYPFVSNMMRYLYQRYV